MASPSDTIHKHPRESVSRPERLLKPRTAAFAETPLERACMQVADRLATVEAEDELNIVARVFEVLNSAQQDLHVQRLNERIEKGKRLRSTVELYLKYAFSFAVIGLGAFLLRSGDAQIGYLLLGLGIGTICGSTIDLSEFG